MQINQAVPSSLGIGRKGAEYLVIFSFFLLIVDSKTRSKFVVTNRDWPLRFLHNVNRIHGFESLCSDPDLVPNFEPKLYERRNDHLDISAPIDPKLYQIDNFLTRLLQFLFYQHRACSIFC